MNDTFCPKCRVENPENAVYCCICGRKLSDLRKEAEREEAMRCGKIPLLEKKFETESGIKKIRVVCGDIMDHPEEIDLLTVSAFRRDYRQVYGTLIWALFQKKSVSVEELAESPFLDLRKQGNCWISKEIEGKSIRRIGCVELTDLYSLDTRDSRNFLPIIRTYFNLLDVAADLGVSVRHIASPMLGTGNQGIGEDLIAIPLVNEVISFLKRNSAAECYTFFHKTYDKALALAEIIGKSYQIRQIQEPLPGRTEKPFVFISFSTQGDRDTAELICRILEEKGIDHWFAPRDIHSGAYAEEIVSAINRCSHFICLISNNSMRSPHVLNEIDLAFQHVKDGVKILPYRLDDSDHPLEPSFSYYLSRMQWNYGCPPPAEARAREFIDKVFGLAA